MRVVVTGGFGFLGTHLVEQLLARGDSVRVIDSLEGTPFGLDRLRETLPGAAFTIDRVASCNVVPYCDVIYHLASPVGPTGVLQHAGTLAHEILSDAMTVAGWAAGTGTRAVFASTSEVYGGGTGGECAENSPAVIRAASPRAEYAAGKLAADIAIQNLAARGRLNAVILRPFNIAGPRQCGRGGFVLPRFVGQALAGLPLTVYGDGSQRRAFTHVKDTAAAFVAAATKGASGRVFNVGRVQNQSTILQLANEVIAATGGRGRVEHVDPRSLHGSAFAEADDKFPAPGGARELEWEPMRDRAQVIADTVAFMRDLPDNLRARVAGLA